MPLYHFYHNLKTSAKIPTPELKIDLSEEAEVEDENEPVVLQINQLAASLYNTIYKIRNNFGKQISTKRLALAVICLAVILIVPTQAKSYYQSLKNTTQKIAEDGTDGFLALQDSTAALFHADLPLAQKSLTAATKNLDQAVAAMANEHRVLQAIVSVIPVVNQEVASRQKIILAGQKIAAGNSFLFTALSQGEQNASGTLTARLGLIINSLNAAIPNYQGALENLSGVKEDVLPLEYQAPFKDFRLLFTAILNDLKNINNLGQSLQEIFGGEGLRRYLLVFQNPDELRPTGGFMGSFALLDIKDGQIIKMDIPAGGTYDLQGQLSEYVEPPTPLLLSNKRWEFQDANWFPDFPASADKMIWFLRKSRGMSADGVIAINATVLERLLAIMGPLTDGKRNLTLTADNAVATIQQVVETGPEKKANKPKQILADLAPKFMDYFKNIQPQNLLPLLTNLQEALTQKEIQAYFADTAAEADIKSFGWGGQILATKETQDYLMVVNTNIQGQKTDAKIKQTIEHQAVIDEGGAVIDAVTVTREHTGAAGEKLYGETNIDYIRVYVPAGSELISAGGFSWPDENRFKVPEKWTRKDPWLAELEKEIKIDRASGTRVTEEFGKTAFGNWVITDPGQTSRIQFVYRLPFRLARQNTATIAEKWKEIFASAPEMFNYQLIAQRQSGAKSDFESQLVFPETWRPYWSEGQNINLASNGATINKLQLTQDAVWSLIMIKK